MNKSNKQQLENFTYNIAWLRKQHNLSKKEMCKILDISIYNLNKLEKGILPKQLSVNVVFAVWKHFKVLPENQFIKKLGKSKKYT